MAAAESKACSNCEGVLCSNAIGDPGCISGPHHAHLATWTSTSPANAECTRSPVLRVEGCIVCVVRGGNTPSSVCRVDSQKRVIWEWLDESVRQQKPLHPPWCRLLENEGITLKAAVSG